jgi:hypothetical protein
MLLRIMDTTEMAKPQCPMEVVQGKKNCAYGKAKTFPI